MKPWCDREDCRRRIAHEHTGPGTSAPPPHEEDGGASPEVETSDGTDDSTWARRWSAAEATRENTELEARRLLAVSAAGRAALIREMRDDAGLSWADIGEITGLTRSRLNQLYSSSS